MKSLTLLLAVTVLSGCAHIPRATETQTSSVSVSTAPISDFVGAWVLNDDWSKYMGVAIKFDADGTFRYWSYSDWGRDDEPSYPITGTWRWNGPVLELMSSHHLHDTQWHAYSYQGELCLLPEYARQWQAKDGREHVDRLLFKISGFDEKQPFARRR